MRRLLKKGKMKNTDIAHWRFEPPGVLRQWTLEAVPLSHGQRDRSVHLSLMPVSRSTRSLDGAWPRDFREDGSAYAGKGPKEAIKRRLTWMGRHRFSHSSDLAGICCA
jgi:hypothetical protein